MRLDLHETEPLSPNAANHPLSGLRVALETDERQRDAGGGLTFTVMVVNRGAVAISLQRPDDVIQAQLIDEHGRPALVVTPPPAALINARRKPGPSPNAPEIVTIQQGGEHRAALSIRQVGTAANPAPLARGAYHVRIKVLLLAAAADLPREQSYRVFESDTFVVHYGE